MRKVVLEGFYLQQFSPKTIARGDDVVKRYTAVLKNGEGDRITVTTTNKIIEGFIVGEDVDVTLEQVQVGLA